jgi:hypothetical protein
MNIQHKSAGSQAAKPSTNSRNRYRPLIVIGATIISTSLFTVTAGSAAAAAPLPQGPVGGCGQGFTLETLADLQERYGRAPIQYDTNMDGAVCLRLAPPQPADAFIGIVVDNTAVGQRS